MAVLGAAKSVHNRSYGKQKSGGWPLYNHCQEVSGTRSQCEPQASGTVLCRPTPMNQSHRKEISLLIVCFVVADIGFAQLAKTFWLEWDLDRAEQNFRIPSTLYHHDLAKMADGLGKWGRLRYRVLTNSLGFRDMSTRVVPLVSKGPRIVLIGDSFTEGIGYDYDKTFAGIIAQELAQKGIEVLNAGVVSYSPVIYYRKVRFLLEGVGLKFDQLIVFLDLSDIQDEAVLYEVDEQDRVVMATNVPIWVRSWVNVRSQRTTTGGKLRRILKNNSVTVRFATALRDRIRSVRSGSAEPYEANNQKPLTDIPRSLWTIDTTYFAEFGRRGLEKARSNMDLLAAVLRRHGVSLTVVVYPWPDQVLHDTVESRHVVFWRNWAKSADACFINLFDAFFKDSDANAVLHRYFIPMDVHFNESGNNLVAMEFLAKYPRCHEQSARN